VGSVVMQDPSAIAVRVCAQGLLLPPRWRYPLRQRGLLQAWWPYQHRVGVRWYGSQCREEAVTPDFP
jgi:hypothetical protein